MGQKRMTLEEKKTRRRALSDIGVPPFEEFLAQRGLAVARAPTEIMQLNIGLYCNQACNHCHVESSPKRKEMMDAAVARKCVEVLRATPSVHTLDITGGAPEMNDQFRYLVQAARALDGEREAAGLKPIEVIDRCNLTVLLEPGQEDLPTFLADQKVRVVASLPCYSSKNVNQQRGNKVFERSIKGLQLLNDVGYGAEGSGLYMDLVYNPLGAFLPPPQEMLQAKYAEELQEHFGVRFNELFTMTNMPIKRFADLLYKQGRLAEYMQLLVEKKAQDAATRAAARRFTLRRAATAWTTATAKAARGTTARETPPVSQDRARIRAARAPEGPLPSSQAGSARRGSAPQRCAARRRTGHRQRMPGALSAPSSRATPGKVSNAGDRSQFRVRG